MRSIVLKTAITHLVLIMLLFVIASCAGPHSARSASLAERQSKPSLSITKLEKAIHVLINKERQEHGLYPISFDEALSEIARKHSRDMSERKYFDHYSPEGHDFVYRYEQARYQCAVVEGRTETVNQRFCSGAAFSPTAEEEKQAMKTTIVAKTNA